MKKRSQIEMKIARDLFLGDVEERKCKERKIVILKYLTGEVDHKQRVSADQYTCAGVV